MPIPTNIYGAMRECRAKDGSLVIITGQIRVRHANKAWGFYNRIQFRGINADGTERHQGDGSLGAAQFEKAFKDTGREWRYNGGKLQNCDELVKAAEVNRKREAQWRAQDAADSVAADNLAKAMWENDSD
jgi:hypothetical protein